MSRAEAPSEDLATVRILMTHDDGSGPLSGLRVWLRWRGPEQKKAVNPMVSAVTQHLLGVQSMTDNIGGVTFCNLPPKTLFELVMLRPDGDGRAGGDDSIVPVSSFSLDKGEVVLRSFQVTPPR
jgi:hypothetical protein